jgi:hypothetical protein
MSSLLPAPRIPNALDLYKTVYQGRASDNSLLENVRWYAVQAYTGSGAPEDAVALALAGQIEAEYLAILSTTCVFTGVSVQNCDPTGIPRGDAVTYEYPAPQLGLSVGDQMPGYVAGLISFQSGAAGRSKRGRFYAWPMGETDNDITGVPTPAYLVKLNALAQKLRQGLTVGLNPDTTGLVPVLYSRKLRSYTGIASAVARPEWATLRRRKIGRGR